MRFVSIDIETLGLDPATCDVIEFGAVVGDVDTPLNKLSRFHCYLTKAVYRGQPYAMAMHAKILKRVADREPGYDYVPSDCLGECFADWLEAEGMDEKIVVAGKNFQGFDLKFLELLPDFTSNVKFHHRQIDPATLYFDPFTMDVPPSLGECLELAGINTEVQHTAIEDALDVIRCLRFKWNSQPRCEKPKQYWLADPSTKKVWKSDVYHIFERLQDEGPFIGKKDGFLTFEAAKQYHDEYKAGPFGSSTMLWLVAPDGEILISA